MPIDDSVRVSFNSGLESRRNSAARMPLIDRSPIAPKGKARTHTGLFAILISIAMVASGFSIVAVSLDSPEGATPDDETAQSQTGPKGDITYTLSNFFELYEKSSDYADLGGVETMGKSQWWDERSAYGYPDLFVRDSYPFTMLYDYYSAELITIPTDVRMGHGLYTFYRTSVDAVDVPKLGTGSGKDLHFIPILNPSGLALDGGSLSWNWQVTYLTSQECADITAGTHYANTYYNVPAGAVTFTGGDANDGWWTELHGTMTFDRAAAVKYLNLPGSSDLRDEFATANTAGAVNSAWANHWSVDGTAAGKYDIYATYDWPIDSGTVDARLSVDDSSTGDSLKLRIWGHAWGYETLMTRYLERSGIDHWLSYAEDIYVNGSCAPANGDLQLRYTSFYHMLAWKDPSVFCGAWNLDTVHTDACPNTGTHPATAWGSHYNDYAAYKISGSNYYFPKTPDYSPGTLHYGEMVRYWQPPEGYNLSDGEDVIIKLPDSAVIGYEPYRGANDLIDSAKVSALTSHSYWGELVLGNCYPSAIADYYDPATKTITLEGPLTLNDDPVQNPTHTNLNLTGSPQFVFAVSKVSSYELSIAEEGPYYTGVPYTLTVTAKNLSGTEIVTGWNGTVTLSSNNPGTTFGSTSHTFVPGVCNGVWVTTVTFGSISEDTYINATDAWFPLDVNGSLTPDDIVVVIPEFTTLLIPVVAVMLMFALARRKMRNY